MDWSNAKPGIEEKIVEEGNRLLESQLAVATSADQRAAVLAAVFTAAATAILAGIVTIANSETLIVNKTAVYVGSYAACGMFFLASILCILAVMPVGFYLPGTEPKLWVADLTQGKEVSMALRELCDNIQSNIADNLKVITRNAGRFAWGAGIGIAAPIVGTAVWLATTFIPFCR